MLIIKTGSAISEARTQFGDFDDWFRTGLGRERFEFDVRQVDDGNELPPPDAAEGYAGVVVTGSAAMVSHRHDWSERCADWLASVHGRLPMLGVCYGHQLIAHALGGRVGPNPEGRRMGTRMLEILDRSHPLFHGLETSVPVQVTHLEVVLDPPPDTKVIGRGDGDPYHAINFGKKTWGVQFHPEFSASIMASYVRARRSLLEGEGLDSDGLLERIQPAPAGAKVLQNFAETCLARLKDKHHAI